MTRRKDIAKRPERIVMLVFTAAYIARPKSVKIRIEMYGA